MEVQIIDKELLVALHEKAKNNERKRINFDLRTTPSDTSQRMLNFLEPGTYVPIHRHIKTSETIICLEGVLEEVFYEEVSKDINNITSPDVISPIEVERFREIARYRISPREKLYGIQIPQGAWHSVEVLEPSCIFESKDGAYEQ